MKQEFIEKHLELSFLERFMQILPVIIHVNAFSLLPLIVLVCGPVILLKLNSFGHLVVVIYFIYIHFDNATRVSTKNGQGLIFLIRSSLSNYVKQYYFPIELIKTADLKADRNYLFASFPHGITCIGVTSNMSQMNAEFLKLFPGIQPKIATLNVFFWIPFVRELLISRGLVPCSKHSVTNILSRKNDRNSNDKINDGFTANALAIMVGGIKEFFETSPGIYCLRLLNRKGFVKIAIQTGSPIVPTFTFGEVDVFDQVQLPSNVLIKISTYLSLVYVLLKCFLVNIPKRQRLVQVVGMPIEVQKQHNPSPELVDEIHQKVIDSLQQIFHTYKHKYLANADTVKLIIK
ncbi:2-acylglycerol O-acyltransferase 2-like [Calliphora vicina]|uniref:2-acylglycerol O-acyltransferase 2-like n=1 Tax=Calliphora vicina TaxID=7373 RepID=UPI00325C04D2